MAPLNTGVAFGVGGPRHFASLTLSHALIFLVGITGLLSFLGGGFYTGGLYGRFNVPRQPALRIASLPRLVDFGSGVTSFAYLHKPAPTTNITDCGGVCLTDPYYSDALATVDLPTTGFIDHWRQLFHREVFFGSNGAYTSSDIDMAGTSFGFYTCVTVVCWATFVICLVICASFFTTRINPKTGAVIARFDDRVYRPQVDVLRSFLAAFVFASASVFNLALSGESVFEDMTASALIASSLVFVSLSLERDIASFVSISHNSAFYDQPKAKDSALHPAHHASFTKIGVKWIGVTLIQALLSTVAIVGIYNYALPGDAVLSGFRDAVLYEAPYTARWFGVSLSVMLFVYHFVPPLLHLIPVIQVMRNTKTEPAQKFGYYVRDYAISNIVRLVMVTGVVVILVSAPPLLIDPVNVPIVVQ